MRYCSKSSLSVALPKDRFQTEMSTNRDPRVLNAATQEWYNAHPEVEDNRLHAHRIEFEVTLRAIILHLPDRPGLKILDIGGGTGACAPSLAFTPGG